MKDQFNLVFGYIIRFHFKQIIFQLKQRSNGHLRVILRTVLKASGIGIPQLHYHGHFTGASFQTRALK